MDEEIEEPRKESGGGAPAYMTTFADLMSLLMCFFVLMLSFSEMDAQRFKLLSGSMRDAFGVQADIEAKVMPKGTSLITKEFQPGQPKPTPMKTVRQFTTQSNKSTLKFHGEEKEGDKTKAKQRDAEAGIARDVKRIEAALQKEIEERKVGLEVEGSRIIINILERSSFDSGSADVKRDFLPVLAKIRALLADVSGWIMVAGHTDNVPIATARFRSNWELSSSRAVSVAHELLQDGSLDPERFVVTGHADTLPLAPNETADNRARNRRVEISIVRDDAGDEQSSLSAGETQTGEMASPDVGGAVAADTVAEVEVMP